MHTVYIIYSPSTDQYHIGQAKDLRIALWQHNSKAIPATAEGKPWELKYQRSFETRRESSSLEMKLKYRTPEQWAEFFVSEVTEN
jgi:putative endonuclease